MRKPTGKKATERGTGDCIVALAEVPYRNKGQLVGYRVQALWTDPLVIRRPNTDGRRKKWLQNWREAEKFAETKVKELEVASGRNTVTFNEAAESWLKRCEKRVRMRQPDLSAHTLYNYRNSAESDSTQVRQGAA